MARSHRRERQSRERIKEEHNRMQTKQKSIATIKQSRQKNDVQKKKCDEKMCDISERIIRCGGNESQYGKNDCVDPYSLLLFTEWFVMIVSNIQAAPTLKLTNKHRKNETPSKTKAEKSRGNNEIMTSSRNDVNI